MFILNTDASQNDIWAEIIQVHIIMEERKPSFIMTPEQKKYCTTRKELLYVMRLTRQFRHYLLDKELQWELTIAVSLGLLIFRSHKDN